MLAAAANELVPEKNSSEVVGLIFLLAALLLTDRERASHYGLALGGLLEPAPLSLSRMATQTGRAIFVAAAIAALVFPFFWLGYVFWYQPTAGFAWSRAWHMGAPDDDWMFANLALLHLLVVALPEEAFFRGFLQTSLADRWQGPERGRSPSLGRWGSALVVSSVLFAAGHLATTPQLTRLAVFFPSLLFGLVRDRTRGIGAAVVLHAACNLFSTFLSHGYWPS